MSDYDFLLCSVPRSNIRYTASPGRIPVSQFTSDLVTAPLEDGSLFSIIWKVGPYYAQAKDRNPRII